MCNLLLNIKFKIPNLLFSPFYHLFFPNVGTKVQVTARAKLESKKITERPHSKNLKANDASGGYLL